MVREVGQGVKGLEWQSLAGLPTAVSIFKSLHNYHYGTFKTPRMEWPKTRNSDENPLKISPVFLPFPKRLFHGMYIQNGTNCPSIKSNAGHELAGLLPKRL